jgi:CRISPR system Cascade subunit CasC
MSRFIQIHTLTSYPASLLNRDDAGFAKRIPFGGDHRVRVSSQCLKRHWRSFDGVESLKGTGAPMAFRSRVTFDREVYAKLREEGVEEALARAVTEAVKAEVFGESDKKKAKDEAAAEKKAKKKGEGKAAEEPKEEAKPADAGRTEQVTVLGRPEVDYFLKHARAVCAEKPTIDKVAKAVEARMKDARKNLAAIRVGAGLDAAMFGRMVTSDILARCDAAVHVAHAFTVHAESAETDYFSAIDELERERDETQLGSGHIGTAELTTGLFYGYVVVDVPLLVSNLEGCDPKQWDKADRALAREVVRRMVHMTATVSPGAKRGSTAPHAYAHAVLVEAGDAQPRTLANAFLRAVDARGDLLGNTYRALDGHLMAFDGMYGKSEARAHAAMHAQAAGGSLLDGSRFGDATTLPKLAAWAAEQA